MTPQRFESEELDEASLEYLRAVRASKGHGAPGVFLDEAVADVGVGSMPGWGAVAGCGLLFFALILMYALLWNDPLNLAMLLTALVVLGGWLIVAWVRVKLARGRASYVGHFKYVDPLYLWEGVGTGVIVTPLRGLQEARCRHKYASHGSYESSDVRIVMEEGFIDLKVKSEVLGEALESYVSELVADREGLPVDRGLAAAKRARVVDGYDEEEDEAEIEAIPEPHKERGSFGWVIRYALVGLAFGVTLLTSYQMCRVMRDASLYSAVENGNPPDLRVYVADRRNSMYRTEAVSKLKGFHDRLADAVEQRNGDAAMKRGMADLIRAVHASPTPVISMAFTKGDPKDGSTMEGILGPSEAATMSSGRIRQLAEKDLATYFKSIGEWRNNQQIGDQIVAFGEATGDAFAMILIDVRLVKPDPKAINPKQHSIVWKVRFQRSASEEDEKNAVSARWKQDVISDDPRVLEIRFRSECEQFPARFTQYLQNPIPDQQRP
jgi:hypothetical protein